LEIVTVQIISWNFFNVDLSTDFFAKEKKKLTTFLSSWPLPIILVLTSAMACLRLME
jgi:hypothetical protein